MCRFFAIKEGDQNKDKKIKMKSEKKKEIKKKKKKEGDHKTHFLNLGCTSVLPS
jgi:hypothetical protein